MDLYAGLSSVVSEIQRFLGRLPEKPLRLDSAGRLAKLISISVSVTEEQNCKNTHSQRVQILKYSYKKKFHT